ncbi:hypothetical protein N7481_007623 [Penicillium waksmanii]|uniref:uncharacterized protein n=1 Tax=Penicillium waksmanii TaxID=69791 RepID=UPI002548FF05|nr:uncharacterized protein N7481_007623 [Penicillium waksmanii]KAJ5980325.1 hypothetical protein N7481_007623 [Penicillium waksmanii]
MPNGYSDVLYGYREPNNRYWQAASRFDELALENPYGNITLPQQPHCFDGNAILPTPIPYPIAPTYHATYHEMLGSKTAMFQSPRPMIQQPKLFDSTILSEWLNGQEATSNHPELHERSLNFDPSDQLEEKGKDTAKETGEMHCGRSQQLNP